MKSDIQLEQPALKQCVRKLVLDDKYFIAWQHIKQRGHRIEEYEIKTVLLHGRHTPDRSHPNRYNAFGTIPPNRQMRVVYTLTHQPDGIIVVVITAFED